jgi:hypothetical protein
MKRRRRISSFSLHGKTPDGPAQQVLGGYPLGTPERPGEGVVRERVSGGYLERYLLKKKIFHEATLEPSNLSSHKIPTSLV